jgi:hypothetical protein
MSHHAHYPTFLLHSNCLPNTTKEPFAKFIILSVDSPSVNHYYKPYCALQLYWTCHRMISNLNSLFHILIYSDLPACSSELALQLEGCLQIEVCLISPLTMSFWKTLHMNLGKYPTGMVREGYWKFYYDKLYNSTSNLSYSEQFKTRK